jgi:hypothetical protein
VPYRGAGSAAYLHRGRLVEETGRCGNSQLAPR